MAHRLPYHESVILGHVGKWRASGLSNIPVLHLDFNQYVVSLIQTIFSFKLCDVRGGRSLKSGLTIHQVGRPMCPDSD